MSQPKVWLTTKEVKERYHLSDTTIWRLVKIGQLPCYHNGQRGAKRLFLQEDTDGYFLNQKYKGIQ